MKIYLFHYAEIIPVKLNSACYVAWVNKFDCCTASQDSEVEVACYTHSSTLFIKYIYIYILKSTKFLIRKVIYEIMRHFYIYGYFSSILLRIVIQYNLNDIYHCITSRTEICFKCICYKNHMKLLSIQDILSFKHLRHNYTCYLIRFHKLYDNILSKSKRFLLEFFFVMRIHKHKRIDEY